MTTDLDRDRQRFAGDADAAAAFERLAEAASNEQDWETLAALYRWRIGAPALADHATERARLLQALGTLLEDRLGDGDGAIEAYRDAVRLDAALAPAWQGLRRLYAARRSWTAVLQVAELEAGALAGAAERAKLFQEMGRIWRDELADPEQAEQYLERARQERDGADPVPEPDPETERIQALVQDAWISAARGDSSRAVAALQEALESDASNVEAIDMLVTVLDGAERHEEMADLLERRAALAPDATTRAAVLARLGQVREEQLGDVPAARAAYERALDADPRNAGSQAALMRIHRATESWTELRNLLERLGADGTPDQRAGALVQLGLLLERQFDDVDAAVASFEEALALDPGAAEARAALDRLRASPADASDERDEPQSGRELRAVRVVGVLERKLARLEEEGRGLEEPATQLRLRLAELRSATLGDAPAAIEVLEPCIEDEEALLLVAQRLALLYERTGRPEALIALSRRAAACAHDPTERAEWYRRAAETARASGDGDLAIELFGRLLEERPGDRHAENALLALHRARGDAAPLATLLERELARASRRDELPLHLELAQLLSEALGDDAGALSHWRRVLALDPSQEHLLDDALRCANATGGALHQLDLLDHVVAAATAPEDRARLWLRRGDVLARGLGWSDEASESWRRAVELDPNQSEARARLASIGAAPA